MLFKNLLVQLWHFLNWKRPQIKVSSLVNRWFKLLLLSCPSYSHSLFLANHCQSVLHYSTIGEEIVSSQTMALWFWKQSCTSAQCLSNLNRAYWNEIQILFSSSSLLSHPCCFCDARNDVCFRLRAFKWVDVLSLRLTPNERGALFFWKEHDEEHLFFSLSLCAACQHWVVAAGWVYPA